MIPLPLLWFGGPPLFAHPGERQFRTPQANTPLNLAFQAGVQLGLEVPSELRLWESPGSGQHKGRSVWSLVLPTLSTTQCHPSSVLFPTHQDEALPDPEPRHLFCVGSQWSVKCLHNAAGFADVNKVACSEFSDPEKAPQNYPLRPPSGLYPQPGGQGT